MNERVEQTWVVRRIGTIGPAVTIPAENKNRETGFAEGVEYLRRAFRELARLSQLDPFHNYFKGGQSEKGQ